MSSSPDLLIALPCRAEIKAVVFSELVSCLLHGAMYWASRFPGSGYRVQTFTRAHVVEVRNAAVEIARSENFEWVLWLDDDMAPGHDLLERLHATGKDFVGAVAYKRIPPYEPCVARLTDGKMQYWDPDPDLPIAEVDLTGFACVLTRRTVLDAVYEATDGQPFQMRGAMAEDAFFCQQARKLGIPIHVVPSIVVGHAGDVIIGREHRLGALAAAGR